MFSENNKISERQIMRLLTYDLLGLGTLVTPPFLGRSAGRDGIFCIGFGMGAVFLYLRLLKEVLQDMNGNFFEYLREKLGDFLSRIVCIGYLIYFVLLAGNTAYLFSAIVLKHLLREESFFLVLAMLLLLVCYGMWGGIEGRARIYEILFWVLLIPLFLLLFSAFNEVKTDYWMPVFTTDFSGFFSGSYAVSGVLSTVFLLLFLVEFTEKKEVLVRAGQRAVGFAGSIFAVLYLVLVGIFGADDLSTMDEPAVTLMSTVKISGGFLKRTDAFMFGIWFFTLYALLGSMVFHGARVLCRLMEYGSQTWKKDKNEKRSEHISIIVVLITTFLVASVFYKSVAAGRDYQIFLRYLGLPFLVVVPLLLVLLRGGNRRQEKRKQKVRKHAEPENANAEKAERSGEQRKPVKRQAGKISVMLFIVLGSSMLSGCGTAELEERSFPIELAIEEPASFAEEWLNVSREENRVVDYNHLKVILLAEDFLKQPKAMQEFLDFLEEREEVPRNTYVVAAEHPEEILALQENMEESVGNYLEQLFENVSEVKKNMYPTIGMLYQEQENRLETLMLPYVEAEGGKPVVKEYEVWKRGKYAGRVDSDAALLSFFTQNAMDSYTLILEEGAVRLTAPHNEIVFFEGNEKTVYVDVNCEGELLYADGVAGKTQTLEDTREMKQSEQIGKSVEAYLNDCAARTLGKGIDVTNSYRKLGGYAREWYFEYPSGKETYEEDVNIVYNVQITWVNL